MEVAELMELKKILRLSLFQLGSYPDKAPACRYYSASSGKLVECFSFHCIYKQVFPACMKAWCILSEHIRIC